MIKIFPPNAKEVKDFRKKIFEEDLGLSPFWVGAFSSKNPITSNKFAHWYSDEKFLSNGFDQVLLYYHGDDPVGMCCGTLFNPQLYRGVQMYYILKRARRIKGLNTLHFRENGFFDFHISRAKELGCEAVFISVDTFDRRHEIMFDAMRKDLVGAGHMTNDQRKYTAKDLTYLDDSYPIMNVQQRVCFHQFGNEFNFDSAFYGTSN